MSVLVDSPILFRTFRIRFEEHTGTGFLVEWQSKRYLVTASHVVKGVVAGNNIGVRHDESWMPTKVIRAKNSDPRFDVTVLDLELPTFPAIAPNRLNCDFHQGQEIAICGFPLGLEMQGTPDSNGFPMALVKGGVFSGFLRVPESDYQELLFDTHGNKGFSGGPVLVWNKKTDLCCIVGVVTRYEPDHKLPVLEELPDKTEHQVAHQFVRTNSGFTYGSQIKVALDLAEEMD